MAKPDLSGCYAKLEWADAQINLLDAQVHAFLESAPYSIAEDANIEPGIRIYKLKMTGQVTDLIRVGIGQVIAAQRDSLDYLAVALAKNNGATRYDDTYFPIAKTESDFFEAQAQRKIRRLSDADKGRIASFKPFGGGNDLLATLHWLNIKSKHRELIAVFDKAAIETMGFRGNGYVRRITVFPPDNPTYPDVSYVRFDADPGVNLNLPVQIVFSETDATFTPPVVEALRGFSRLCRGIIGTFG